MYLRNVENASAYRSAEFRTRNTANTGDTSAAVAPAAPATPSRGAFFEMMLAATPAPAETVATVRNPSTDQVPAAIRGGSQGIAPLNAAVRNMPSSAPTVAPASTGPSSTTETEPPTGGPSGTPGAPPNSGNPVDDLNDLLRRLGFQPATFNAQVTSTTISVPGLSYEYPLLEVTVNGERIGFHLPAAMNDLRMTATNIASMLGRPVMNFAEFG